MPRDIPAALQSMLDLNMQSFRQCWRVERTDGQIFGFTNHTRDLTIAGVVYQTVAGLVSTAIKQEEGLNVDNMELSAFLTSANEVDIEAGKYDFAKVTIFEVNYQDTAAGQIILGQGYLGQVIRDEGRFTAELRGLRSKLDTIIGQIIQPLCNADLGDDRCKAIINDQISSNKVVDFDAGTRAVTHQSSSESWISAGFRVGDTISITGSASNNVTGVLETVTNATMTFTSATTIVTEASQTITVTMYKDFVFNGTVTAVNGSAPRRIFTDSNLLFADNSAIDSGWFIEGKVEFLTGNNAGIIRDVRTSTGAVTFTTKLEFPFDIQIGDTFTATTGCDLRFSTCRDKFQNVRNFRGFPHVPTNEKVLTSPIGY